MKKTCCIIVYNYESLPFLKAGVRQIRKYKHPDIEQCIVISEQSSEESYKKVVAEFGHDDDVVIVRMKSICSGYSIDYIMRYVDIRSEYICTLDVDAFPIHKNWLYVPIKLLEEENFSFVGVHADIESAYEKYGKFYIMSQHFRVGRTKDFKELSLEAGFTKFTHRWQIGGLFGFNNNGWGEQAKILNEDGWSDSSVTAHWWEDNYRKHNKFTFSVTGSIGVLGQEPLYGRVIDGLVFHFAFSFTSIGSEGSMGEKYLKWTKRINDDFSDELIEEMLSLVKPLLPLPIPRQIWDGARKEISATSKTLNDKIEKFKNK